jgi:uncharacterized paraquat-inducible protein A
MHRATPIIVLAIILFTGLGWYWSSRTQPDPKKPDSMYRVKCPKCGMQIPYGPAQINKTAKCSQCSTQLVLPEPPSEKSRTLLVPGAMAAVALLLLGIWLLLTRPAKAVIETYYYFRCPGCKGKLRYLARQAGNSGLCPRCDRPCVFPAEPEEVDVEK